MKKFLIVLLLLLIIVAAVGFLLPTDYHIEKRITVQASAVDVHAYVGELTRWPEWTPWEEEDPTIEVTYGNKTTGIGASQSWTGESGGGELTFTSCDRATGITYDMVFIMDETRAPALCAMKYVPSGDGTEVVWTMNGDVADYMFPVAAGYMNLLMKGWIGSMFEQGLGKLKTVVEG